MKANTKAYKQTIRRHAEIYKIASRFTYGMAGAISERNHISQAPSAASATFKIDDYTMEFSVNSFGDAFIAGVNIEPEIGTTSTHRAESMEAAVRQLSANLEMIGESLISAHYQAIHNS